MEKALYETIKQIRQKLADGKPTTFAERNLVNITERNQKKLKRWRKRHENLEKEINKILQPGHTVKILK